MKTRETSAKGKIRKFAMEGFLIRKMMNKVLTPLDRRLGIIVRNNYANKVKVNPQKIVFIAFQGEYTCNPKYICEELIKRGVDYDFVWSADKLSAIDGAGFPEGATVVELGSEDFYKELASAKIWISNSVEFLKRPIKKKKDQIMIETWHGSLGIKRFDSGANSGKGWVKAARLTTKICDYLISNSDYEDNIYRTTYWFDQEIWKFGHPRNDVFFQQDQIKTIKENIYRHYEIEEGVKLCLYAPTFRDSHTFDFYNIDYNRLIDTLEKRFGGTWNVMLRFHPTVRKYVNSAALNHEGGKIKDATDYPDMQELIVSCDLGITDYSSWIYDYVLTPNPGFIYAADLDKYYNERGFSYSLYDTPFPVSKTNDELMASIENYDEEEFQKKRLEFLKGKGCIEDGHASERSADKIIEIIEAAKAKDPDWKPEMRKSEPKKIYIENENDDDYKADNNGV